MVESRNLSPDRIACFISSISLSSKPIRYPLSCIFLIRFIALFLATSAFLFLFRLGFSKCSLLRISDKVPVFSHYFLNLLRAFSKDSFSLILTSGIHCSPPFFDYFELFLEQPIIQFQMEKSNGARLTKRPKFQDILDKKRQKG
jgi:hypothetical protein